MHSSTGGHSLSTECTIDLMLWWTICVSGVKTFKGKKKLLLAVGKYFIIILSWRKYYFLSRNWAIKIDPTLSVRDIVYSINFFSLASIWHRKDFESIFSEKRDLWAYDPLHHMTFSAILVVKKEDYGSWLPTILIPLHANSIKMS